MRRLWKISLLLAVAAGIQPALGAAAQKDLVSAKSAVERFVVLNNADQLQTPEGRALLSGELAAFDQTSAGRLPPPDKLVILPEGTVVARVPGEEGVRPDIYFNLDQAGDGSWSLEAYRVLALSQMIVLARDELLKQPIRTQKDELELRQMNLTLSTDRALTTWFQNNRPTLDRLHEVASESKSSSLALDEWWIVDTKAASGIAEELAVSGVMQTATGATVVTIGGMVDNTVGFVWSPTEIVPPINNGEYIWLEPISGGWFLFKTS